MLRKGEVDLDNRELSSAKAANVTTLSDSGTIAQMAEVKRFSPEQLDQLKILHTGTKNREQLKTFRELRTRVMRRAGSGNFLCLVTSLAENGGASYVASNLAAAVALDKTKTSLLVDCNLYEPSVDRLLAAPAETGLTDFLEDGHLGVESVVHASGIPRLRVVPAGHQEPGATELLMAPRMRAFMDEIKHRYQDRFVFIDSPPVSVYSAEIRILAELCDFVVLVVPAGQVTETEINNSIAAIGMDRLAGAVFNNPY